MSAAELSCSRQQSIAIRGTARARVLDFRINNYSEGSSKYFELDRVP